MLLDDVEISTVTMIMRNTRYDSYRKEKKSRPLKE